MQTIQITPEKIAFLNSLRQYRHFTSQDNTSATSGNYSHLPAEYQDNVRWTIAGVYADWSETTARAEQAWNPSAQTRLWNRADALWETFEQLKSDWGIYIR